jgi:hypothetical protein
VHFQTILGGMGAFLLSSSSPTARPLDIRAAERMGTVIAGAHTAIRAPATSMLFSVEDGGRRRVFGTPSDSGKTVTYDLGPGEYVDAATARRFRVVAHESLEPARPR